ncbi:hypothetical protein SELR_06480 [Selenomonas ruminantium subsp. lactilytica TAM6421]|uniref:DUF2939 domain-containing protein n=2 Tax=Selenomonas ruminantium TaxID=971 RepID=A0A1H0UHJ5_SELRU|nr:hypothetical protein [Selenomonas ruminantium]BAL82356.1 hypothetical protein SELR_06480 [Selenomonas ruminantium subsp. lactilytica TAM6421]SDP65687.1 hypothetical protein SAMN05216366_13319 [Selenomonas ruminantium]
MEEMENKETGKCWNKKLVALVVAVVLIACGVGGYMYYKRTPAYSLQLIQDSVKEHNWEKFSRHVDTKSLADSAFDDIIEISLEEDTTMDAQTKALAANFAKLLKPTLTSLIESSVKEYVETGEFKDLDDKKDGGKKSKRQKENPAENLLKETNADKLKFTGVKSTEKDGTGTVVAMGLHDESLNADYELKIRMIQLEDGTWKMNKIENLKDFYNATKEAEKNKKA